MKIKPWTKLEVEFEDPTDGGFSGGGGGFDDDSNLYDDDGDGGGSDDIDNDDDDGSGSPGNFTPEQVASLLRYSQQNGGGQAPQQRQQFTKEQINEMLKRPKITRETVDAVLGPRADEEEYERAIKGLDLFVEQLSQHAMAAAAHAAQYAQYGIQQQLTPLMAQREAQVTKSFKREITGRFQTLQGKEKVVDMAIGYLKSQGFQPRNQEDAVIQTAKVAARILQQADPNFRLGSRPVSSGNGGMNTFARPSGGGGGGNRSQKGKEPEWKKAFWSQQ